MAIKYISTAVRGAAHSADVLDVAVSTHHTITVSGDGYLKMWKNADFDRSLELEILVDKLGLHHLSIYEDTLQGGLKVFLICSIGFSGNLYMHRFDYSTKELSLLDFKGVSGTSYWAPSFAKDVENGQNHILAVTSVNGYSHVFKMDFSDEQFPTLPQFEKKGEVFANNDSFATCIDIDIEEMKIVVGHQDGLSYLYDLNHLMLLFTLESYGLKESSLSVVRDVSFSPKGDLLAIARDSGAYGSIGLYDVRYGEFLGTLTVATHSSNVGIGGYAHKSWCMSICFNEDGMLLASGGMDGKVRIWDVENKSCEATLSLSTTDLSDKDLVEKSDLDEASCVALTFVPKGAILEDGKNDGLVVVGLDRAVRWFREAGGI